MKLLVLSDLHLEVCRRFRVPRSLEFDAVILAGDIDTPGWKGIRWAAKSFPSVPVIFVAGNHEHFGQRTDLALCAMRQAASEYGVHYLERQSVTIGGVRFLGCTLWTDFRLGIKDQAGGRVVDQSGCRSEAEACMPDYRFVRVVEADSVPGSRRARVGRLLASSDTLQYHEIDRSWLGQALAEPSTCTTVVVTHHAPHWKSVPRRFQGDQLSGSFASDLPEAFFDKPALWVHGHTHDSFDYWAGDCRVVCNPRGYVVGDSEAGNPKFRSDCVIELL